MGKKNVTIVGAGLAGALMTIYLARRGFRVTVFERRPDMRKTETDAGRSINLALSTRGIHALRHAGLAKRILETAIPMKGRMMHAPDGELTFQPYGKAEHEVINAISRGGLNVELLNAAESYQTVDLRFRERCLHIDFRSGEMRFRNERTGREHTVSGDTIIACDGSGSPVRTAMLRVGRFNYSQTYIEHGYKELTIPAGRDGGFQLEKNALHIWPRGSYMLIALPNQDASFTCTLFFPFRGDNSFASLDTPEKVETFFAKTFPDALKLMPTLQTDYRANPVGKLITIKCHPWNVGGRALLLGDSAHAIVPFYGQGMNCAFEDCYLLDQNIGKHGDDWETVFQTYARQRKVDADAIADLALANFVEMRDRVADPQFLMKKQLELAMEKAFPEQFRSTYAMVTFHRTPYARALARGEVQDRILMDICREADSLAEIDLQAALARVSDALEKAGVSPETGAADA